MIDIDLNFSGYFYPNDPKDILSIPDSPGVYCVYSTRQKQNQAQQSKPNQKTEPNNPESKREPRELVELRYIGQSGTGNATLRSRIRQHATHATSDYPASEHYAYSYVKLRANQLDMVEAALVFHFKPRDNRNLTEKYTHSDVDITIDGDCAGLEKSFRLYKDTERF